MVTKINKCRSCGSDGKKANVNMHGFEQGLFGFIQCATCGHKTPGIWYYVDHTPTDKQCVEFADLMMEQWNNGE